MISTLGLSFLLSLSSLQVEVNARLGNEALSNHPVQIVGIRNAQSTTLGEQPTNSRGVVRFSNLSSEVEGLAAVVEYEGIAYFSDFVRPSDNQQLKLQVQVFPRREGVEGLRITRNSYSFDWRPDGLLVQESFEIENSSPYTLIGEGPEGQKTVLRFRLPQRSFNRSLGEGFQQGAVAVDGTDSLLQQAIPPGKHYFSLQYQIDRPRLSVDFSREFSLPVDEVEVLLPQSKNWSLSGLDFQPELTKYFQSDWVQVHRSSLGRSSFDFELRGLPLMMPWTWWLPLLSFFVLLLGLFWKGREASVDSRQQESLLRELLKIRRLREKGLLSQTEFLERKLSVYERLIPLYEHASIKHAERGSSGV